MGRTLGRRFKAIVGVTPKFYARTMQMNAIIARLLAKQHDNLTDLALESGYYDQAHLIHTVRRYAFQNPKAISRGERHMLNWFLDETQFAIDGDPITN